MFASLDSCGNHRVISLEIPYGLHMGSPYGTHMGLPIWAHMGIPYGPTWNPYGSAGWENVKYKIKEEVGFTWGNMGPRSAHVGFTWGNMGPM